MSANKKAIVGSLLCSLALLTLSACIGSDPTTPVDNTPPPAYDPGCVEAFSKEIQPVRLNGGKHLYFNPADLSFLSDPTYQIETVTLKSVLRGRYKGTAFEVPLAINGLQAAASDGSSVYELLNYSSSSDSSTIRHKLDKMKVNGAMSLRSFMLQVKKHDGEIKFSFHGSSLNALSASIEIAGVYTGNCAGPKPSPTPSVTLPPAPVPPVTHLTLVDPAVALTASTSIIFTFESDQTGVVFSCALDGADSSACTSPQVYSNLQSGSHTFSVFATNAAGLSDLSAASHAWAIDAIAPNVSLLNVEGLPLLSNSSSVEFQFLADDPSATFLCSLNDVQAPCASPASYSGLSAGTHKFQVIAIDSLGNAGTVPAEFQWAIDLTAPQTYIVQTSPASLQTNLIEMQIQFAATESATFECSLDRAAFASCQSPVVFAGLGEGPHLFEARATDLAGNLGVAATFGWTVDFTAPVISLGNVLPLADSISNADVISAEFSAHESALFLCGFDGGASVECSSPFVAPVLSDGTHELLITARDDAGNSSSLKVSWIIDSRAPVISFGSITPSSQQWINASWINAEVNVSESSILSCALNGIDHGVVQSPVALNGLGEGVYALVVGAVDLAGNASAPITHEFNVDLTAPITSLAATVGAVTHETTNTFLFAASEIATFECNLNGAGFMPCESPVQIAGFADGQHLFEVRATDRAGNIGDIASLSWLIDLAPPTVTLTVVRNANASIAFSFTASESGSVFECSLDGAAYAVCSSPMNYSGLLQGDHSFFVRAQDAVGNVDPVGVSHVWTVDPLVTTQILTAIPAAAFTNQTTVAFTYKTNVGVSYQCQLDGAALSACSANGISYSGLAGGNHIFKVVATDRWGVADTVGASYSWAVDITPPVITSIVHSYTRNSVTITWVTNEGASVKVNWGIGLNTNNVVPDNGQYTTSHTITISGLSSGTQYSYIVSGTDRAGNVYQSAKRSFKTNF